jgi:hypothetical protein
VEGGGICVTEGGLAEGRIEWNEFSVLQRRVVVVRMLDYLFLPEKELPRTKLRGVPEREPSQRLLRRTHPLESCP